MEVLERTAKKQQWSRGKWVTEVVFAEIHGLSRQTLCNWRYRDHLAGRNEAEAGYPVYKRFGRAVRYWLEDDGPNSQ